MRILIIGSGAVGLGLSAFLIKASSKVTFFTMGETKKRLLENGFEVNGLFGNFKYTKNEFDIVDNYNSIDNSFDFILITTKTLANDDIAKNLSLIKDKLTSSKIVIIQNGWGNSEKYLQYFGAEKVFTSRIITGFFRKSPSNIEITVHADTMYIGNIFKKELSSQAKELSDALNRGGFDCNISQDVDKHLWAKMLYNCALNPLGAILNVEYGKLAENEHSKEIMNSIIDEIFETMQLNGFSTFWDNKEYKQLFYEKLIPSTYSHKSSMFQDLANKRKTEIDSLNGIVVELAKKQNKELPYNNVIKDIIKSKESMF
jgi:2-dehydropantoate 2-reductase